MFSRLSSAALVGAVAASAVAPEEGMRLIAFNETYSQWMTPEAIDMLSVEGPGKQGLGFVDITDRMDYSNMPIKTNRLTSGIPDRPRQQELVKNLLNDYTCRTGDCTEDLYPVAEHLASYYTRHYQTQDAVDAANWLMEQYREAAGPRLGRDISVQLFEHSFAQPSIIVKMIGKTNPTEVVVLGGHIDSVAGRQQNPAPGFDDDASGSATVFATFKNLVDAGYEPDRTVEFHGYAAEEGGLRGSAAIAQEYRAMGVDIVTQTQFDMTCFSPNKRVGLTQDYTNSELTAFLGALLVEYTGITGEPSTCGYGCSDHASFTSNGYAAAFPFEARFGLHSPYIHTAGDTADKCDRDYMGEYAKLGLAYVVEMASL